MFQVLIAAFLFFTLAEPAHAGQREDTFRHAKAATALIVAVNDANHSISLGSGFFVDAKGLLVTNAHVIEENTRLYVYVRDQEVYRAPDVVAVDPDLDLAALRIQGTWIDPLALAAENPQEGTEVIAVGYPRVTDILQMGFTLHATVVPGTVSGLAQGQSRTKGHAAGFIQTTGLLNFGNSGGPLVRTDSGEVAGMVVTTVPYLERAKDRNGVEIGSVTMKSGISYSVPASVIHQWLDRNRLLSSPTPSSPWTQGPKPTSVEAEANRSFATGHLLHILAMVLHEDSDLMNLAIRHYEAAAALRPGAHWITRNLGLAYATLGRWDQALEAYHNTLELTPNDPEVLTDAGLAWQQTGRLERATESYQAAIRVNPRSERAHNSLGTLWWEMGRLEDATLEFRQALDVEPTSVIAAYNLGLALEGKGLREEAVKVWESFLTNAGPPAGTDRLHSQMRDAVNWLKGATPVDLAARAKADGAK
jgi:tetratricopeptide (TPR) repeat protein